MLVALTAFDVAAVSALRRYLLSRTDSSLQSVLRLYQPWPVYGPGQPGPPNVRPPALRAARAGLRNPGQARSATVIGPRVKLRPSILDQYYLVFLSRHRPPKTFIEGNPELVPRRLGSFTRSVARHSPRTVVSVRGNVQLRLQAVPRADGTLVASTSIAEVNRTVGRLELILVIGSAAAGLVVAAGVIVLLRRGLRPIETMAAQADRITAGDLTDRVSPHDPRTEVGRLGTALNGMLARIEASVVEQARSQERTRRFSPTPATSCAHRWPPCAPTPSSTSRAPCAAGLR